MRPSSRAVPPSRPVRSGPGRPPHRLPTRPAEPADPGPEPEPVAPEGRQGRRRTIIAVLVGVGVMVLLVECLAIARSLRSDEPDEPDAPAAALPLLAPDELPERGALVLSAVDADGSVRVSQWVRSGDGIEEMSLAAPAPGGDGDPVRATDVRLVAADGAVLTDDLSIGAEARLVRFADPTTMVRATYVLRGAVERSATVDGRLRAQVVALDVDLSALSGPTVAVVAAPAGGEVLGLACANAHSEVELFRPCGTPDGSRWRVRLDPMSREDRVTAVVDLP